MRLEYRYAGEGAYVGIGIDFVHLPRGHADWKRFGSDGAVIVTAKASAPTDLGFAVMTSDDSYHLGIRLSTKWARYTIPFKSFTSGNKNAFDPASARVTKIEIRPSHAARLANVYIDEIGLEGRVNFVARDTIASVTGVVRDERGKPVDGAAVEIMADNPHLYGWERQEFTRTLSNGTFTLRLVTARGPQYDAAPLEGQPAAAADAPHAEPARRYLLKVTVSGYRTHEAPLEVSARSGTVTKTVALRRVDERRATNTVSPDENARAINPLLYGSNVGLWHSGDFTNPAVIAAARESGTSIIRYPGGSRSQGARWQREEALWCSAPKHGPGNCVLTPNGVVQFIEFCQAVGAEPMISLNVEHPDLDNAMDLVRFLNEEKKFGVKYFEIGNEPEAYAKTWGFGENWTGDPVTAEKTNRRVGQLHLQFTERLKAFDPGILTMGPVTANANFFEHAIPPFWKVVGSGLDVLAVHRYPQTDRKPSDGHLSDEALLARPKEWAGLVAQLRAMNAAYSPDRRPPIAVTEWNTCYHSPGARQQQIVGALYMALNLCEMGTSGVDIANVWVLTGCGYYNVYNVYNVDSRGAVEKILPFSVFKILANNFRGELARCESSEDMLSAYALTDGRDLVLVLVNASPVTRYRCTVNAWDESLAPYVAYKMEETRPFETVTSFDGGITVPAYSLVLVRYGLKE
jgi:hypothetical protein